MTTTITSSTTATLEQLASVDHSKLYHGSPIAPLVWELHQRWTAEHPGSCRYIETIKQYVIDHLPPLTPTQLQNLGSHVYYANELDDRLKAEAAAKRMRDDGYIPITQEVVRDAATAGKKLRVILNGKEEIYRPILTSKGAFILPPRSRTKGYNVSDFAFREHQRFCKII